jgi:hypothetical protein
MLVRRGRFGDSSRKICVVAVEASGITSAVSSGIPAESV